MGIIKFIECETTKHIIIPKIVGIIIDNKVHFTLLVSFFIVIQVVPHGKCISENSITHIAVIGVQPWFIKSDFSWASDDNSIMLLDCV